MDQRIRYYVVLQASPKLLRAHAAGDRAEVEQHISSSLTGGPETESSRVSGLPSRRRAIPKLPHGAEVIDVVIAGRPPRYAVVALGFEHPQEVRRFDRLIKERAWKETVVGGADLQFSGSEHWCTGEASDPIFGDRKEAERLIGVPFIRDKKKLRGKGVNVVIVDQGIDSGVLGSSYGGGWPVKSTPPGKTSAPFGSMRRPHGMMIAHNVLQVAPEATLWDLPMVPQRIIDVEGYFLYTADAAFRTMLDGIAQYRKSGKYPGPWVLVNAWAIFTRNDEHPPKSYTDNPTHPFNLMVAEAVDSGIDVIFCAGNCGGFCPDTRCGGRDQGAGNSIFGANCHPKVVSVGAVRSDTIWLGYSSQGPGQPGFGPLAHDKPDLCAPSQFCENHDAFSINDGTSAATGLTAGVIAALRSNPKWDSTKVPPEKLKSVLNSTARRPAGSAWNNRTGNGILDAEAAYNALP